MFTIENGRSPREIEIYYGCTPIVSVYKKDNGFDVDISRADIIEAMFQDLGEKKKTEMAFEDNFKNISLDEVLRRVQDYMERMPMSQLEIFSLIEPLEKRLLEL